MKNWIGLLTLRMLFSEPERYVIRVSLQGGVTNNIYSFTGKKIAKNLLTRFFIEEKVQ